MFLARPSLPLDSWNIYLTVSSKVSFTCRSREKNTEVQCVNLLGLPLQHPWLALLCIILFALSVATFVSHTVASIVLMPIIARLGVSLHIPEVVVIGSAFAVSAAMALPFSSFPNVNSLLIVDDLQRPYLGVNDFIKTGLPLSLITVILIATLGYVLVNSIIVQ